MLHKTLHTFGQMHHRRNSDIIKVASKISTMFGWIRTIRIQITITTVLQSSGKLDNHLIFQTKFQPLLNSTTCKLYAWIIWGAITETRYMNNDCFVICSLACDCYFESYMQSQVNQINSALYIIITFIIALLAIVVVPGRSSPI